MDSYYPEMGLKCILVDQPALYKTTTLFNMNKVQFIIVEGDFMYKYDPLSTCVIIKKRDRSVYIRPETTLYVGSHLIPKNTSWTHLTSSQVEEYFVPISLLRNPLRLSPLELSQFYNQSHDDWMDDVCRRKPLPQNIDEDDSDDEFTHYHDTLSLDSSHYTKTQKRRRERRPLFYKFNDIHTVPKIVRNIYKPISI